MGLCNGKIKFTGKDIADIAFKSADKIFKKKSKQPYNHYLRRRGNRRNGFEVEAKLRNKYGDEVEMNIVNGGQPIYYFIISVE